MRKVYTRKLKENGITLIALVITIIILLILAGVAIAALSGDNGILKNAAKAKEETEKESEAEGIKLAIISLLSKSNSTIEENNLKEEIKDILKEDMTVEDLKNGTYKIIGDENREYIISKTGDILVEGVNWEETKKITQKHPEQREERNENVIGIGTDGNTVNMDLWEYTKLEDNTFALNDEESIKYVDASASNITKGYLGTFENGKIIGCVPKYISTDGGKTYQEVTNMWATFTGCEQLIYAPAIPNTVTNMNCTYSQCKNLIDGGYVSNSIVRMWATYSGCASLQKTPYLPNTVINMRSTFQDCTSLIEVSNIPEKVETNELQIKTLFDYLEAFNKCINIWSNIHNPIFSNYSEDTKELLKKINFLLESEDHHYNSDYYRTSYIKLLVYSVISSENANNVKKFLKIMERYMFIKNFYPYEVFYSEKEKITLEELFYKYQTKEMQFEDVVTKIDNYIYLITSNQTAMQKLLNFYNHGGFYNKKATPYILWEYEKKLQKDSKNNIQKIPDFNTTQEVFNSIEHIYPKSPNSDYWKSRFNFGRGNTKYRNSLGNLLMLARCKNEKLANKPFNEKCCNKDNNLGYKFGSYSEMEVSTENEWTPKTILNRGIKIIHFINERWNLNIKKSDYKKFLGLDKKEEA